jgi:DNA-nicking Smr family endonuclease
MTRRRQLSDEERVLWKTYARSIKPLRSAVRTTEPDIQETTAPVKMPVESPPTKPRTKSPTKLRSPPRVAAPPEVSVPKLPSLAPLDRRTRQRVARGRDPIEARLDLHGMTQIQAHAALLRFLRRAQGDGAKTVLVVTGKGLATRSRGGTHDADHERGVLRRQVPMWLALPEFRLLVVGFDDAHAGHGGQGALYVRLRRAR